MELRETYAVFIYNQDGTLYEQVELTPDGLTIGRLAQNGVSISDEYNTIARRHAQIDWDGAQAFVTDLGAGGGTRLGGMTLPPYERIPWDSSLQLEVGTYRLQWGRAAPVDTTRQVALARLTAALVPPLLTVMAGQPVWTSVVITNQSDSPATVTLEIDGPLAQWIHGGSTPVTVPPGKYEGVALSVQLPSRLPIPVQAHPVTIHVRSVETGQELAEPLTTEWSVLPSTLLDIQINPSEITDPIEATYKVLLTNHSQLPMLCALSLPRGAGGAYIFDQPKVQVDPESAREVELTVRGNRRMFGDPFTHNLTVRADLEMEGSAAEGSAVFIQTSTLPVWSVPVALLALLLLAAVAFMSSGFVQNTSSPPIASASGGGGSAQEVVREFVTNVPLTPLPPEDVTATALAIQAIQTAQRETELAILEQTRVPERQTQEAVRQTNVALDATVKALQQEADDRNATATAFALTPSAGPIAGTTESGTPLAPTSEASESGTPEPSQEVEATPEPTEEAPTEEPVLAINVDTTSLTFGTSVVVGESSPAQTVTVKNEGNTDLLLEDFDLSGTNAADFSVDKTQCTSRLAAGATCAIPVTFSPQGGGKRTATLTAKSNATSGSNVVALEGTTKPQLNSITLEGERTTKASSVRFVLNFSEPVVNVPENAISIVSSSSGPEVESINKTGISQWEVSTETGNYNGTLGIKVTGDNIKNEAEISTKILDSYPNSSYIIDTTKPKISFSDDLPKVSRNPYPAIRFNVEDLNLTKTTCTFKSNLFEPCVSPFLQLPNNLEEGKHKLVVSALDGAGNETRAEHEFDIDNISPTISFTQVPDTITNKKRAEIRFTVTDASSSGMTITCQLLRDNQPVTNQPPEGKCNNNSFSVDNLEDGNYAFEVKAVDAATNPASLVHPWTIDSESPTISFSDTPPNRTTDPNYTFAFQVRDSLSSGTLTIQCQLDNRTVENCNGTNGDFVIRGTLGDDAFGKTHTFKVTATDAAGNKTELAYTWRLNTDRTDPDIEFRNPLPPTDSITFCVTDNNPVVDIKVEYRFTGDNFTRLLSNDTGCFTVPISFSSGRHRFTVRATDMAGNTDQASYEWQT